MDDDNSKLKAYLMEWQLSDPELLRQTMTSHIYRADQGGETVILKLLSSSETEEQRGAASLRYFDGRGAVRLLRWDEGAQLLEYAGGDELVTLVERGEDAQATEIIADLIKQLHSIPQQPPADGLVRLDRWFEALLQRGAADTKAGIESIYARSAPVAAGLLAEQREIRVLHGDIHHRNIRQSPRGWLSFDPKGLVGERTYDCANTLCNPVITELVHNESRLLTNAAILAERLAIDLRRVLAFTYSYACLNACWWSTMTAQKEWEEIMDWHLKVAVIIEPHLEIC